MAIKVIVFDFDGTLIDSNKLKYDAFFELFPSDDFRREMIGDVLTESLEETRCVILREILKRIEERHAKTVDIETRIEGLASKYNDIVIAGAKTCKEKPGATRVLESLSSKYQLYLSSTTPETALKDIVKHRKWNGYFCGIFGYPKEKIFALLEIMQREKVNPNEVLVAGDGEVDRISAKKAGCRFFPVYDDSQLKKLIDEAEIYLG